MIAKCFLCFIALLCVSVVISDSNCGYGNQQIWDVKRVTGTCQTVGGVCTVFDFQGPFVDPYDAGVKVNAQAGQYYQFFYSGEAENPIGLNLFNADGSLDKVVATAGKLPLIGDKGFLYVAKLGACGGVPVGCGTGYFFARNGAIYPTSGTQFSFNVLAIEPTLDDLLYKYHYDICVDEPKYATTSSTTTTTSAPSIDSCKAAYPEQFKSTVKKVISDPIGSAIQGAIDVEGFKLTGLNKIQNVINSGKFPIPTIPLPNLKGGKV